MVVDIRPATGAVVTLARILWGVLRRFESGPRDMRANALCTRVESPVRNRSSVSALPFCVRFSRKANVYKSFVRRDW